MKAISIEVMLLRWSETSNGGATIVLQLVDASELEPFKAMSLAKGKQAGQLLQAVLVPIEPEMQKAITEPATKLVSTDVVPPKHPLAQEEKTGELNPWRGRGSDPRQKAAPKFPDGLTGLAVRWCADPHFQDWMAATYIGWDKVEGDGTTRAKVLICRLCNINSRSELNTNDTASARFRELILEPYAAQRKEDGLDDKPF